MQVSNKAIDLIKEFEGFNSKTYLCPAGKPTIGYGHKITDSLEPNLANDVITIEQAENLLTQDLKYFAGYLNEICKLYDLILNQNQFDALCSFTYNLGSFKDAMLERFKHNDIKAIGDSLLLYNKANGIELQGLTARRKAEQELYFS